jgi:hypothetical protein
MSNDTTNSEFFDSSDQTRLGPWDPSLHLVEIVCRNTKIHIIKRRPNNIPLAAKVAGVYDSRWGKSRGK